MNYLIKLTKAEVAGVYVLEQMVKRPNANLSHSDRQAATLVVKKMMEAVEADMLVKFITP